MLFGWVSQMFVSCNGYESYNERKSFFSSPSREKLLLHCKNINCFHYFKYYLLNKMLIFMGKWFAGFFLGVLTHYLLFNIIRWAKLLNYFQLTIITWNENIPLFHLKWEYSPTWDRDRSLAPKSNVSFFLKKLLLVLQ